MTTASTRLCPRRTVICLALAAVLGCALWPASGLAQDQAAEDGSWADEDDWGDEESDQVGFADTPVTETSEEPGAGEEPGAEEEAEPPAEPSPLSITGFARTDWALWAERFDENPFAKGRQSLDLEARYQAGIARFLVSGHAEYDFAYLNDRDSYDQPTLETYEWLVDVRETYVVLSTDILDITLGRQIVAWGEGDMVSTVDVVNPRDLREPGLADLDDLRLPVLATRLGLFIGYHRVETMVVHESFFGYRSPPFGPFSPLPALLPEDALALLGDRPIWYLDRPGRFGLNDQQYLARWSYKGPGVDLAVYVASVLDQQGVFVFDFVEWLEDMYNASKLEVVVKHPRYTMIGHSGAWPLGDWLLKWELFANIDRTYNIEESAGAVPEIGEDHASMLGGLAGITYSGISDTMISLEMTKAWLTEELRGLLIDVEEPTVALRYSQRGLRDDLELEAMLMLFGWAAKYGWLARFGATYTILDALKLGVGYITYQPGSEFGMLSGFGDHDRVYAQLRWDFNIY